MNTYHTRDEQPKEPGAYWCMTITVGPRDAQYKRMVTYSNPMHIRWDGERWQTTEGWSHWYGEAQHVTQD